MPIATSTLIQLASSTADYTWDAVTGILYTSGGLNFYIVILIIGGVIAFAIACLKMIFDW